MTGVLSSSTLSDGGDRKRRQQRPLTPRTAFRITLLGFVTLSLISVLIVRLWFLQVIGGQAYAQRADDNIVRTIVTPGPRGIITDRTGKVILAQNRSSLDVVAFPRELTGDRRKRVMTDLADALGLRPKALLSAMHRGETFYPYQPAVLMRDVPQAVAMPLAERIRSFPGVQIRRSWVREYPQGTLAAHILGYVGTIPADDWAKYRERGYQQNDLIGRTGIEAEYEQYLRGISGQRRVEVDAFGDQVGREFGTRPPEQGKNLRLSIDIDVQRALESQLRERTELYNADGAAGVALDAQTGEILGMASYPTYEPNAFVRGDRRAVTRYLNGERFPLLNRAVASAFPPASTFKPITAIGAMEEGILDPNQLTDSPSKITLFKKVYKNFQGASHGLIDLPTALEVSSDTYFFQLGKQFYDDRWQKQGYRDSQFGFGQKTHIDLPSEDAGRIPTPSWKAEHFSKVYPDPDEVEWKGGDDINMAVGQGNLIVTPLQLARAYAAIANGGKLLTPVIGQRITDQADRVVRTITPARPPQSLDLTARILNPIHDGLSRVTHNGNGTAIGVFGQVNTSGGPSVSGKTGTAEAPPGKDHAWFVGYAPSDNPRIVVAIVVEHGGTGSVVAAPAVCRVIASYNPTKFDAGLCGTPSVDPGGGD